MNPWITVIAEVVGAGIKRVSEDRITSRAVRTLQAELDQLRALLVATNANLQRVSRRLVELEHENDQLRAKLYPVPPSPYGAP